MKIKVLYSHLFVFWLALVGKVVQIRGEVSQGVLGPRVCHLRQSLDQRVAQR